MSALERFLPSRLGVEVRWLTASSWVGNIGDGIALAAGPLLIASETRSAFLVAAAALLERLPWLVLGLWAGAIADRVDRRGLLILAESGRVVVVGLLAAGLLGGRVPVPWVLAAMFGLGTADVFSNTTSATLLPMLVSGEDLGLANSRLQGSVAFSQQLVGPPLGAFLFTVGRAWPFATQAIIVLAALLMAWRIGARRLPVPARPSRVRADIAEGVRWLLASPPVRTLALTILAFNITWGAAWSVLVLDVLRRLHLTQVDYGWLTAISAVGGLVTITLYRQIEARWSLAAIMRVCLSLEVCTHLGLALDTNGWIAAIILFVFGAYTFVWATVSSTVRQRAVPTHLQGRISSVYMMGVFGGIVIGQGLGGAIAQAFGIAAPFWFAFAGSGITLALVWRRLEDVAHAEAGESPAMPV